MAAGKIRDDLVGVVYLADGRKLAAGDTVPDDAEQLGEHVLAKSSARATAVKGGAGKGGDGGAGSQS